MLQMILPALISGAASAASGIAAGNASAKQSRLAMIQHAMAEQANREAIAAANAENRRLGYELLNQPLREERASTVTTKGRRTRTSVADSVGSSVGSVDYEGMLKAAEASGINPITFIRNGGLAAFARMDTKSTDTQTDTDVDDTTVTEVQTLDSLGHNAVAAYQLMSPTVHQGTAGPQQVIGSNAAAIAGGVQDAVGTFMNQMNRKNTQDFQRELLAAQLKGQQDNTMLRKSFYTPGFATAGGMSTNAGSGGLSAAVSSIPYPSNWKQGEVEVTNPWFARPIEATAANADTWETRYGEIGGVVGGVKNAFDDFFLSATGMTAAERNANPGKAWGNLIAPARDFLGGLKPIWGPGSYFDGAGAR